MKQFTLNHKGKLFTLALFILFILALPVMVKAYIISNIEKQGFDDVTIKSISFAIFEGSITVKNVNLKQKGKEKLVVGLMLLDYRLQSIFSGGIETELIELRDINLAMVEDEEGNLEVVIPLTIDKAVEENPEDIQTFALPKLDVDLIRFSNVSVDIQLAKLKSKLNIEELTLTRLSTWHDYPAELILKAKFNDALIDINLQAKPLAAKPTVKGTISISDFQLADFQQYLPTQFAQLKGLFSAKLNYDGSRLTKQQIMMKVDGTLSLEQLEAQYALLGLSAKSLKLNVDSDIGANAGDLSFNVSADSLLTEFKAVDTEQNYALVDFKTLELTNLTTDENINLGFDLLQIDEFNAVALNHKKRNKKHLAQVKQLQLTDTQLNLLDKKLSIEQVLLLKLTSIVNLDNEYQLTDINSLNNFLARFNDNIDVHTPTKHANKGKQIKNQPFIVNFNQIAVSKGSVIRVAQEGTERKIRRDIFIDEFNVSQVIPSDVNNKSKFTLKAKVGEFTTIDMNGDGKLFAPQSSIKASGRIDEISLARISPFIEPALGYQFVSGQLDHKFDLAIENNIIDMNNELVIRKIEIKETEAGQEQNSASDLMPLPMAISMLENSDRTIDLEVPIKGDLANSEVGLESVIKKALSKAMQKGSLSFLKYSLQPYGAVVFATEYLIDESKNVQFEAMHFPVNSVELSAEQQAYADKLAEVLTDREQINLSLCGYSNAQDKEQMLQASKSTLSELLGGDETSAADEKEMNQLLTELASNRAKAVKRYFMSKNIKSTRLFLCKAKFQSDEISGVKISM